MGDNNIKNNDVNNELVVVEDSDIPTDEVDVVEDGNIPVKYPDNPDAVSILKAFYDPTELSKKTGKIQWFLFPVLPSLCYMLFALQLYLENLGEPIRAGNILIVPIGALCGYSIALLSCLLMFVILKLMKQEYSFTESVAVLSGCFVAPALIELFGTVLKIATPFSTTANIGAFGLFIFMMPLSYFAAKNSKGKLFPVVWLTIISVINVLIICLMMKVGGVV